MSIIFKHVQVKVGWYFADKPRSIEDVWQIKRINQNLDYAHMFIIFEIYLLKDCVMPRPKKDRLVHEPPLFSEFKPAGISSRSLEHVTLSLDEFEAVRLADFNCLLHQEAAEEMDISRSTFTRLVEDARKKIAGFLLQGKVLVIEGGNVHFKRNITRCISCGHLFKTSIDTSVRVCPECQSQNLINLAGGFGHGKCCSDHHS